MSTSKRTIRCRRPHGASLAALLTLLLAVPAASAGEPRHPIRRDLWPADDAAQSDADDEATDASSGANSEEHLACMQASACKEKGYCTAQGEYCVAATDSDCEQAAVCRERGRCTAAHGRCLATNDTDCQRSRRCDSNGRCHAARGICVEAPEAGAASAGNGEGESGADDVATASGRGASFPSRNAYAYDRPASHYERQPMPYHEGDAIPDGYRLESSPRYGLVAAGASVLGSTWLISMVTAIALDEEGSVDDDPNFDDMYTPMFIPVVGPFITIGTADASGTGAGILALDGVVQSAGLAMFIAGFAAPKLELVPRGTELTVTPVASGSMTGVSLSGTL